MPKFLILRFSSIGDIVLTTPVVRCLKQQVKDAEVHYCTKKQFTTLVEHSPWIDKRFYLGENLSELISELKKEKYDAVIDLHHNLRTFRIKSALGVKSYSFDKLNFEKWLIVNFKINRLPGNHIVDRYMETVKPFGVVNDGKGLEYFLLQEDGKALEALPPAFQNGYIAFVIGAKHATKRLPLSKMIELCCRVKQPLVLLGGKEDYSIGEEIIKGAQSSHPGTSPDRIGMKLETIFNGCGKFSLNQSAALVKHAGTVITHDTGLMHIAAAFKKKIVSIWGNTIPEFGMSPYFGNTPSHAAILEVKNLYCRPCSKIGFEKCPKKHFRCMNDIPLEEIIQQVNQE